MTSQVPKFPALHGLIDQLPDGYEPRWTPERRQDWIDAFLLCLDYSVGHQEISD